jgi:hypothetical protein
MSSSFDKIIEPLDRVSDPGNTIIAQKKNVGNYLTGRMVIALLTTLMFIYAVYDLVANEKDSDSGWTWWFWLLASSGMAIFYGYYTYGKIMDMIHFNKALNHDYFKEIKDKEYMFIYGDAAGKLSDFKECKNKSMKEYVKKHTE